MILNSLCLAAAALVFSGAEASECGTLELRTKISTNMDLAIDLIEFFEESLGGWCADGSFPCPVVNTTDAIANLTQAKDLFNITIYDYATLIADPEEVSCNLVDSYCSCRVMTDATAKILEQYETSYAPLWLLFSTTGVDCEALADQLRNLVILFYCYTEDIISSLEACPGYCQPCSDSTFEAYVSNNMDDALQLFQYVNASLVDYCGDRNVTLTCATKDAILANLTQIEVLVDITFANFSQFLNTTIPQRPCRLPEPQCSCSVIGDTLARINSAFRAYEEEWKDFISDDGRENTCESVVLEMARFLEIIDCGCAGLKIILGTCPCGEDPLPPPVGPIEFVIEALLTLWEAIGEDCRPSRVICDSN